MNFTLTYDGDLMPSGNASTTHKHEIRRIFHQQLCELWKGACIANVESLTKSIGKYNFFPLVSSGRRESAELRIIMLRPGSGPGYIVGQGGDIDNRLKTLFDSLRIPGKKDELPRGINPQNDENPFFCLLEDDILITDLSVTADRLLEPCSSPAHVKLIIGVHIKQAPIIGANMILTLSRL